MSLKPPEAAEAKGNPPDAGPPPAVSDSQRSVPPSARARMPAVLDKRADFLKAARARRVSTPAFTLQARRRAADEAAQGVRVGYTCSKKVGNAVARNRAKRRLREIARAVLPTQGQPGWDYVLIGRPGVTATRALDAMTADLETALQRVHGA